VSASGKDLAYVIYTSGSTGVPNGVMITHEGINNRLLWMQMQYQLNETDTVLQKTPFTFDVSVWEFFWPLISGARLVIARPEGHKDPYYLADLICKNAITTLHFVPSMLNAFLESGETEKCTSIKRVFCSGEALSYSLQQKFFEQSGADLYNLYGPTEASVDVTHWTCVKSVANVVPIGRPISNIKIYILDELLNHVPIGVPGMLYIGGVGLAKGYLNRKELTAEKFIENPYSGERLYKTGDIARFLADGAIEFIGRADHQVKIRGYRIELGELESALLNLAYIKEATTRVIKRKESDDQLIGYIVPKTTGTPATAGITQKIISDQVTLWKDVFDSTYQSGAGTDITYNTAGYVSSYTGQSFTAEQVNSHLQPIIRQVQSWNPKTILDIGCGTGLTMHQLIGNCSEYYAVDFSEDALLALNTGSTAGDKNLLARIKTLKTEASELNNVPAGHFDVIVLNSVLQYCPDSNYVFRVLRKSLDALKDKGSIVIGNVRSLKSRDAFYASVEVAKAENKPNLSILKEAIEARIGAENELFIDYGFFELLPDYFPEISAVEIRLKYEDPIDEFRKFRYDVIVCKGKKTASPDLDINYKTEKSPLEKIENILHTHNPKAVLVTNIPNHLNAEENRILDLIKTGDHDTTVINRQEELKNLTGNADIENIKLIALKSGYNLRFSPVTNEPGAMNILLSKDQEVYNLISGSSGNRTPENVDWGMFFNNPIQKRFEEELASQCQNDLKENLPDYMLPAHYVFLKEMPLTSSGKVDKKRLPVAAEMFVNDNVKYFGARNEMEEKIILVWARVLATPDSKIGIDNNFFDLGGNSITLMRMRKLLNESLSLNVSIPTLFRYPNIRALTDFLNSERGKGNEELDFKKHLDEREEALNLINRD
jgi:amino acid adenylation domain-containing protein